MTLEMTPSDKFSDDPWWSPYWAETWSHVLINHQPNIMTIIFFNGKSPKKWMKIIDFTPMFIRWWNPSICLLGLAATPLLGSNHSIPGLYVHSSQLDSHGESPSYAHHFAIHWCPFPQEILLAWLGRFSFYGMAVSSKSSINPVV